MFRVKIAKYEKGFDKYVVVNENMEVFEPVFLYSERLHATRKISTTYNYLSPQLKKNIKKRLINSNELTHDGKGKKFIKPIDFSPALRFSIKI